ncbi:platelet endothelial cell adhesion molecule-like isoform X2 [Chiloscyllium plagiosum]|uniref:platelet endothelial cell adhesion molecule-like isoform X2 n=1 Tax=Chiloscyllium plagiosum TaxID=36176 RepID=UPI001CB821BA|nr:platelet endothelial cell adhesion molecule-like isoform X2 [Chiloscyllium plagiosum]
MMTYVKEFCLLMFLRNISYLVAYGQSTEVVITHPRDGVIKEGEWFTLKCRYNNRFITAFWYKNNIYEDYTYHLRRKADSKTGGSYQCRRNSDRSSSSRVEPLKMVTIASDMTLTVQVHSTTLLLGETSVLKCSSYSWRSDRDYSFLWYRNNFLIEGEHESEYTIAMARFSDGATYRCEQKLGFRKWISLDVSIIIKDLCSKPTLQADPDVEVFIGEGFNLVCLTEPFHENHPLLYTFYKNRDSLNFPSEKSSYAKEEATVHHSGSYQCEVTTRDSNLRKKSNIVLISIKRIPVSVPDLSAKPGNEVMEGDSTWLNCSVTRGSTPIQYIFYKDSQEIYWEYSNHSRTIHTIANISKSQEGNYHCAVSNQEGESLRYSKLLAVSVIVHVAGVFLKLRTNKKEILIGSSPVLECVLSRGTRPYFQWYFQQKALNNVSVNYNFSSDWRELAIESFQSQHQGQYRCSAINRGPSGMIFNVTSNPIDLRLPAQQHSAEMAAIIVPLFLILSLLTLLPVKLWNRKKADSSSSSRQQREMMGNRAESKSEDRPARNFDYAEIESSQLNVSSCAAAVYSSVKNTHTHNDDSKMDGSLLYSVVTISKPRNAAHSDGAPGTKHADQAEQQQSCIIYATLRHTDTGGDEEVDQDQERNVYANVPRKL